MMLWGFFLLLGIFSFFFLFFFQCATEVSYLKDINALSLLEGMGAGLCGSYSSGMHARAGKK